MLSALASLARERGVTFGVAEGFEDMARSVGEKDPILSSDFLLLRTISEADSRSRCPSV